MSNIGTEVLWDRGATDELVRQLLATAGAVGEVVAVLGGEGPVDASGWGGPHRAAFDADRRRVVGRAEAVAEALVAAAGRTAALAETAAGEERLRVRLRHQAEAAAACAPGRPC